MHAKNLICSSTARLTAALLSLSVLIPFASAQDYLIQVKPPEITAGADDPTLATLQQPAEKKLYYGVLQELGVKSVQAEGWLKNYLTVQRDGLTGHLENGGYPFNTIGWNGPKISDRKIDNNTWASYEQYGYWVDAMIRCGYQINDDFLLSKAKTQIEYVLNHPDADGILGPENVPEIRWPHVPFFRSLMAEYSATGDRRIIDELMKHYKAEKDKDLLNPKAAREICNVEQMCWLYGLTGERWLLDYSVKLLNDSGAVKQQLQAVKTRGHGPCNQERYKLPMIIYLYSGDTRYMNATLNVLRLMEKEHMLVDGSTSAAEDFIGNGERACHETCNIMDMMWSMGYALMATGDVEWADKIERAALNAAPGAAGKDFKTHEYYSAPNQVLATHMSNHEIFQLNRFAFRPGHDVECCTGSVSRNLPNYLSRMWMSDTKNGVVAVLYGPSRLSAKVGTAQSPVTIVEKTDFPFDETVEFEIQADKPATFPLHLRIPGWCANASLTINGKPAKETLTTGKFATINREFKNGDKLVLTLPMTVKMTHWPHHGVALERGPLVYSLLIKEKRTIDKTDARSTPEFPAYDIMPASPWNYALDIDEDKVAEQVKVVKTDMTANPYAAAPIQLQVPARKVKEWELEVTRDRLTTKQCTYTPALPRKPDFEDQQETVTLVPLGSTYIRLTVFPWTKAQW